MTTLTRIRTRRKGGQTLVMVLVRHPMESGQRKDATSDRPVSAHYIQTMVFRLNGDVVAQAYLGPGVAANPPTSIVLAGAKAGDRITVRWSDNQGGSGGAQTVIA